MPIRDIQFSNNEFYHIIKRGVEGRSIFLDDEDRIRFINSLLVFNDIASAPWSMRGFWVQRDPNQSIINNYKPDNPLVEIHSFALMDNHFHLLIKQLRNGGISTFMNKLGGYSYYFNKKNQRVGPLFQGRFKAVLIKTDEQLRNSFVYVNTNPVGLIYPSWKEKGVPDLNKANNFLKKYKWSSWPDYLGQENYSSLLKKDFFMNLFGSVKDCEEEILSWLQYKVKINEYDKFLRGRVS